MTKYNELSKISVVQERIATGHLQDAQTRIYVMAGIHGHDDIVVDNQIDPYADRVIGYYTITHPSIMAGTLDESIDDFCHVVKQHLIEDGLAVINDYGILFVA